MSRPWGPQATGGIVMDNGVQEKKGGVYWVVFACMSPFIAITGFITALVGDDTRTKTTCPDTVESLTDSINGGTGGCSTTTVDSGGSTVGFFWTLSILTAVVGLLLGIRDGRKGVAFAHQRTLSLIACFFCATLSVLGYAAGYFIGKATAKIGAPAPPPAPVVPPTPGALITASENPHQALLSYTHHDPNGGGGWIGWSGDHLRTASPRQAMLVIGPPGSMKTTAVIIPSVLSAIGPTVTTSMKQEVMIATAAIRSTLGRNFQFDPSTTEPGVPGALIAHWSPLVGLTDWDSAARRAQALSQSHIEQATGNGKHFMVTASQIIGILLYTAHLEDDADMTQVYRWVTTLTTEDTQTEVYAILDEMTAAGDEGAEIAFNQFKGYADMSPQELSKYLSSAGEILEAYKYVSVRRISKDINFDPHQFVRSRDTLHITVPDEYLEVFAPVVTALLDSIRNAAYQLHRKRELGVEPKGPHVTFVLDEVTIVAPVSLPKLVAQAGGQGLHLIAAMQSNTQAIDRWHNAAKDFLSMFPTKLILPGVADKQVLDTLSELTGEYDRVMMGYSQSTTYLGEFHRPVTQNNPNWSTQRQRVLTPADISNPPQGYSVMFQGGQWDLVQLAPVFHQFWQLVIERTPTPALRATTSADQPIGGQQVTLPQERHYTKEEDQQ